MDYLIGFSLLLQSWILTGASGSSWYIGCYVVSSTLKPTSPVLLTGRTTSASTCSTTCLDQELAYALLSYDVCYCDSNLNAYTRTDNDRCGFRCLGNPVTSCGGNSSFSVFSRTGPFISRVFIQSPSKAIIDQPITITASITLASLPTYPTGLADFVNATFNSVNVFVSLTNHHKSFHVVTIVGKEGSLKVVTTCPESGFKNIVVDATNAVSSKKNRKYLQVFSKEPSGIYVQDATYHELQPSCIPSALDHATESLESTSVVTGYPVTLRASITQGVNVTFDWNVCGLEQRSSTPYLTGRGCVYQICLTDEQTFTFNRSGICQVTVTVHNHLGSVNNSIHVMVISPEIKDLSIRRRECVPSSCDRLFPTYPGSHGNVLHQPINLQPPWMTEEQFQFPGTTTTTPPMTTSTLPPSLPDLPQGTYFVGSKVCFHALVFISIRREIKTRVHFGDGSTKQYGLNEGPRFGGLRLRRDIGSLDPYAPNERPSMSPRSGNIFNFYSFQNTRPTSDMSACYDDGCKLNIYFSHRYSHSGIFKVCFEILNSTHRVFAKLNHTLTIIDRDQFRGIRCMSFVQSETTTEFDFMDASDRTYTWNVARKQSELFLGDEGSNMTSSEWVVWERITSRSPLRHVFSSPGYYKVRIQENGEAESESAFCNVIVEERIEVGRFRLRSESGYVGVGDVIRADLFVKKGSNFSMIWIIANETFRSSTKYNAPYRTHRNFRSSSIGCKKVKVIMTNSVGSAKRANQKRLCFEEKIASLRLVVSERVPIGEPMNITVLLSGGSHVHLHVTIVCCEGIHFHTTKHYLGAKAGPSAFKFTTQPFNEPGEYEIKVTAHNHVTLNEGGRPQVVSKWVSVNRDLGELEIKVLSRNLRFPNDNGEVVFGAFFSGSIEDIPNILYKWVYPNDTQSAILYSASPIVKLRPHCNDTPFSPHCLLNLTANSGASVVSAVLNLPVDSVDEAAQNCSTMRHPAVVAIGKEFSIEANCSSFQCCEIRFSDSGNSTSCWHDVTTVNHTFFETGLQKIILATLDFGNRTMEEIALVHVQNSLTQLEIQGDSLLLLEDDSFSKWRAVTTGGSHLVYQWKIVKRGAESVLKTSTGVTCVEEFRYRFQETGVYDVTLSVFNGVSHKRATKTTKVRLSKTFFDVTVEPVYLKMDSQFHLKTNISNFMLNVKWSLDGDEEQYSNEQLTVLKPKNISSNVTSFRLRHRYSLPGLHHFRFALRWSEGDDVITRNTSGQVRVFEFDGESALQHTISINGIQKESMSSYAATLNDDVSIDVQRMNVILPLVWTLTQNGSLIEQRNLSSTESNLTIAFTVTSIGTYKSEIAAGERNFSMEFEMFVSAAMTLVVLERPYSKLAERFVDFCELGKVEKSTSSCTILFGVKGDGANAIFQFRFQHMESRASSDDDIIRVLANRSNAIFPETSLFKQAANAVFTFKKEGTYNISVAAYSNRKARYPRTPLIVSYLRTTFHVVSAPNVSLSKDKYYVEVDNSTTFQLLKLDPDQDFNVDWDMGDGTMYKNAGLTVTHSYLETGLRNVEVLVYNAYTSTRLSSQVQVEAVLTGVTLNVLTGSVVLATRTLIRFTATTAPLDVATEFTWYLNNQTKTTYHPLVNHEFLQPGGYLVKVVASNSVSRVESTARELILAEPVSGVHVQSQTVMKVGQLNWFKAYHSTGSDVECNWYMGDDTMFWDTVNVTYSYLRPGIYTIKLEVGNDYNSVATTKEVFLMDEVCPLPSVSIPNDGFRQYYRSNSIWFEAKVEKFDCPQTTGISYRWTVSRRIVRSSVNGPLRPTSSSDIIVRHNQQVLRLDPGTLDPGEYRIYVNVSLTGTILYKTAALNIKIKESKIIARIKGGFTRLLSRNSNVIVNATQSYDPNSLAPSKLRFSWRCFVLNDLYASCFKNESASKTTAQSLVSTIVPNTRQLIRSSQSKHDPKVHSRFPFHISTSTAQLNFPASLLINKSDVFLFQVNVSSSVIAGISNTAEVVLKLTDDIEMANVDLSCPRCTDSSVIKHLGEVFVATCSNCVGGSVEYEWKIVLVDDDSKVFYKYGNEDCAPLDGSGWKELTINASSNATLTQNLIADYELAGKHLNNTSNDGKEVELHPDDQNFIGVIPQDDFVPSNENIFLQIKPVSSVPPLGFNGDVRYDGTSKSIPSPSPISSSPIPQTTPHQQQDPMPLDFDRLKGIDPYENDNPSLQDPSAAPVRRSNPPPTNMPQFQFPTTQPGRSNMRESQPSGRWIVQEGSTSSRYGASRDITSLYLQQAFPPLARFQSTPYPTPSTAHPPLQPDNNHRFGFFHYNTPQPLGAQESFGKHTPIASNRFSGSALSAEGDDVVDETITPLDYSPDHYQNLKHNWLPFNDVAVVGGKGRYLKLKPNSLEEGKLYSVAANVQHKSDSGEVLKTGMASYYFRVIRGPSYGICSLLKEDRNDSFRMHCFQWRNKQNDKIDTATSRNAMIFYELSYSLSEGGTRRPIYYGTSHEQSFQLPYSPDPVFVSVVLYNSYGAKTDICSLPVNVTGPERPDNQSEAADIDYVYGETATREGNLFKLLLKGDEASILAYVNTMIDSLPPAKNLHTISKENSSQVGDQLEDITSHLLSALASLRTVRQEQGIDILSTLTRMLDYHRFLNGDSVKLALNVISDTLSNVTSVEKPQFDRETYWERFARNIEKQPLYDALEKNALESIELIASSIRLREQRGKAPSHTLSSLRQIERSLRNFALDFQSPSLQLSTNTMFTFSSNMYLFAQKPIQDFQLLVDGSKIGAYFPNFKDVQDSGLLYSGMTYLNHTPYISRTQTQRPQLDESALTLWITDKKKHEVKLLDLNTSVIVSLPVRRNLQQRNESEFEHSVDHTHMSVHVFNATHVEHSTLHVEIQTQQARNRDFTVLVAFSSQSLSTTRSLDQQSIIDYRLLPSRRTAGKSNSSSIRFMFPPRFLPYQGTYYISLWSKSSRDKVQRFSKQVVRYNIATWWSDCYLWKEHKQTWMKKDCKVSNRSTLNQTFCSSSRLATFTSSFELVSMTSFLKEQELFDVISALSLWSGAVLGVILFFLLLFFSCAKFILVKKDRSSSDYDYPELDWHPPGVADWLRWWLGTDDKGKDGKVPVILRDNKSDHSQIFEITIQTGCWPGSGTTSSPFIILYGEEGKYEARELSAPIDDDFLSPSSGGKVNGKDCFLETGSSKTFIATYEKNLGPLTRVCIWHDHSGWRPRWFLDYVIVRDVIGGEKWYFSCRSWLALDRGPGLIGVDLSPLEERPRAVQQLAARAMNLMLDMHSMVSIVMFARWGRLTRMQRLSHCFALVLSMIALSVVRYSFFASSTSDDEEATFHHSISMGCVVALLAHILLLPARLILRYSEKEEAVSVMMEDITNDRANSPSVLGADTFGDYQQRGLTHGLRRTTATTNDLDILDYVYNDVTVSRKHVVSDWLKKDLYNDSSISVKDAAGASYPPDNMSGFLSRQSFSSSSEEIARCMMTSSPSSCSAAGGYVMPRKPTDLCIPGARRYPAKSYNGDDRSVGYEGEDDLYLAMDGPVLVHCEKLDPIPQSGDGPLPRQCSYFALLYYAMVIASSTITILVAPTYTLAYVDHQIWMETALFAVFWSAAILELVFVAIFAVYGTVKTSVTNASLNQTLSELFPAVDAATVDDYVYRNRTDVKETDSDEDEYGSSVLETKDIDFRISERQRCRYLRNISPPHDESGHWRSTSDTRRKLGRTLKKSTAANRACAAWRGFLFLAFVLLASVGLIGSGEREKSLQTSVLQKWISNDFIVDRNLFLCDATHSNAEENLKLKHVSDFYTWKHWFRAKFLFKSNGGDKISEPLKRDPTCNYILLSSVKITSYFTYPQTQCRNLPEQMRKILSESRHCDGIGRFYNCTPANTSFIDVSSGDRFDSLFGRLSEKRVSSLRTDFVIYSKVKRIYSLATAYSAFSSQNPGSYFTVYSTFLQPRDSPQCLLIAILLFLWITYTALTGIVSALDRVLWRKSLKRSTDHPGLFSSVLSFLLWITVVSSLVSFSIFRHHLKRASEILEKSGHLLKDPESLISTVSSTETSVRWILGIWTVLLICKLLEIVIKHHGVRTPYTRATYALYLSVRDAYHLWIVYFVAIISIFSTAYITFSLACSSPTTRCAISFRPVFSPWFTFLGFARDNQYTFFRDLNADFKAPLVVFTLLFVRLALKGFFVASHQWFYSSVKHFKCLSVKTNMAAKEKGHKKMKTWGKRRRALIGRRQPTSRDCVTFREMFSQSATNLHDFVSYFPLCLKKSLPFLKAPDALYAAEESSTGSSASLGSNPSKSVSFEDYDRSKLADDEDDVLAHDFSKVIGSVLAAERRYGSEISKKKRNLCQFQTNTVLSEFELQIDELSAKTTPLLDEELDIFLRAKKGAKTSVGNPEDNFLSLVIKLIVGRLLEDARKERINDDVMSCASTSLDFSASKVSLERCRRSKLNRDAMVVQSRIVHRSEETLESREQNSNQSEGRKSMTSLSHSYNVVSRSGDNDVGSERKEKLPSPSNSSSGSSLTTLNLAKHNHRLFRRRASSPDEAGASFSDSASSSSRSLEESAINCSFEKTPDCEKQREERARKSGSTIWKSFLSIKNRALAKRTKLDASKRGTLRRSQTVFIDVKDLPAIQSSASSPGTSPQSVLPPEKVGFQGRSPMSSGSYRPPSFYTDHTDEHLSLPSLYSPNSDVFLQEADEFYGDARNLPGFVDDEEKFTVNSPRKALYDQ